MTSPDVKKPKSDEVGADNEVAKEKRRKMK